jgi:hypothetical protein
MNSKVKLTGTLLFFAGAIALSTSCKKQENGAARPAFTKIDSLTEAYLALQDSMLLTWNVMMKDENEKIENAHLLLQQLKSSPGENAALIESLEQRLEQLKRIQFTQRTMINPHVVEEYDFASNALISEIIYLAEANPTYTRNTKMQQLTDGVKSADQRVLTYREEYDAVVYRFNQFLEEAGPYMHEIDEKHDGQKKVLFTSDER